MSKKKTRNKRYLIRNAGLTATVSMALVLFLVGLFTSILLLTRNMSNELKENLNLSIVLNDDITEQQTARIKKYLEGADFSKSVTLISKEQALEEHIQALGEDPAEFLGWNPLFASLEVKLKADYAHNDSLAKIEAQLKRYENINKVVYQKDMIAMVNDNVKKISFILIGLAAIMILISFALINNTVRLRIYANRFLINTMKLVGAKSWFIRKPYVGKSVLNGLTAALLALLLLTGMVYYLKFRFGLDSRFISTEMALVVSGVVIITGVLLAAVSSYFAVGKYVRMQTDELYYI